MIMTYNTYLEKKKKKNPTVINITEIITGWGELVTTMSLINKYQNAFFFLKHELHWLRLYFSFNKIIY